jgi:uncharacterized protein (DUF2236 family)
MTVTRVDLDSYLERLREQVSDPRAGLFGPRSKSWEVSRETVLFLGGGRASLLQLAHPFVAHGVEQHSATKTEPLGRFIRTFEIVYDMVFGDLDAAFQAARRAHTIHKRVTGTLAEDSGDLHAGDSYAANTEEALLWVHATLVDSAVLVHDLVVRPLALEEKEAYYQESKRFASLFGIPESILPVDWAAFEQYNRRMWESNALFVGRAASEMAHFLLQPPHPAFRPFSRWYTIMTAGLLPPRIRDAYQFRYGRLEEAVFEASLPVVRLVRRGLPEQARWVPAYLAARQRLDGEFKPGPLDWVARRALARATKGRKRKHAQARRNRHPAPSAG